MWLPVCFRAKAAPFRAVLSDSLPPLVKTTSLVRQPRTRATDSLASSTALRDSWARVYRLEALPNRWVKYGSIASITSGRTGVVAA